MRPGITHRVDTGTVCEGALLRYLPRPEAGDSLLDVGRGTGYTTVGGGMMNKPRFK